MENKDLLLTVNNAEYVRDHILLIHFSNGKARFFDFTPLLSKGVCNKLKDLDYFKRFSIDPFTIDWNNEIGFAPEFLYDNGVDVIE